MNRFLLTLLTVTLAALLPAGHALFAQQGDTTIQFNPSSVDFKEVYVGERGTSDITISNQSQLPAGIAAVQWRNGGCFTLPSWLDTVPALGERTGSITFRPTTTGECRDTLLVWVRTKQSTPFMIPVRGLGIRAQMRFNRDSIDFRAVPIEESIDTVLTITNNGNGAVRLVAPIFEPAGMFSAPYASTQIQIMPGMSDTIRVRFRPTAPGSFSAMMWLGGNVISLRGQGRDTTRSANNLFTRPETIDFGPVPVGQCYTRVDTLHYSGTSAITIDGLSIVGERVPGIFLIGDSLKGKSIQGPGGVQVLKIQFCPTDTLCPDSALIRIATDAGDRFISVRGCGMAPLLNVRPASHNFGAVDSCAVFSFTLTNPGDMTLRHSVRLLGGRHFSIDSRSPDVDTIAPGDTQTVTVRFCTLTASGDFLDTLQIESNAFRNGMVSVIVRGSRGGPPPPVWEAPPVIEFGDVRVFGYKDMTAQATNVHSGVVDVQTMRMDQPFGDVGFALRNKVSTTVQVGGSLPIEVRFSPRDTGIVEDAVVINPGTPLALRVIVRGRGVTDTIVTTDTLLDFGEVAIGERKTLTFNLLHTGNILAFLQPPIMEIVEGPTDVFTTRPVISQGTVMVGGDVLRGSVTFQPRARERYESRLRLPQATSGEIQIRYRGVGVAEAAHDLIPVETFGDAGNLLQLPVRIDPPITPNLNVTKYHSTLRFDPKALYPVRAFDGLTRREITLTRPNDSTVVMDADRALTTESQDTLFFVEFRALSTGRPLNTVYVEKSDIDGLELGVLDSGVVHLSGCELGRVPGASKRARIESLRSNPGSDQAELIYHAAAGAVPRLRVMSVTGQELESTELQRGTGSEQRARIRLDRFSPGFLLIELRVGNDRSVVPIMYTR